MRLPLLATAAAALLVLGPGAAWSQDAVKPCKPSRQADNAPTTDAPPGAQQATGTPKSDQERQMANSSACEASPPDTR